MITDIAWNIPSLIMYNIETVHSLTERSTCAFYMSCLRVNLRKALDWYARCTVAEISREIDIEVGQISLSGLFRATSERCETSRNVKNRRILSLWRIDLYRRTPEVARMRARNQAESDLWQAEVRGRRRTWRRERRRDEVGKLPARFGRLERQKNPHCREHFGPQTTANGYFTTTKERRHDPVSWEFYLRQKTRKTWCCARIALVNIIFCRQRERERE